MASFDEHITHSKSNLEYLSKINDLINNRWDWQVTVCFYSALHLINAHLVSKTSKNYLNHKQVDDMINPYIDLSISKLDEATYLSYTKLSHLSRRSRYLLNENFNKNDDLQIACATHSPHFKKAIYHLDVIIDYIKKEYKVDFVKTNIKCIDLNGLSYNNFSIINM